MNWKYVACALLLVSILVAGCAPAATGPTTVRFATQLPGRGSYPVDVAVSGVINTYAGDKLQIVVESIGAAQQTAALVETGEADLQGSTPETTETGHFAEKGLTSATTNLRSLSRQKVNYQSFLLRPDRGINTVQDIRGKRIYCDAGATSQKRGLLDVLSYYGVKESEFEYLGFRDAGEALKDVIEGKADGLWMPMRVANIEQMRQSCGVVVMGPGEEYTKWADANDEYNVGTLVKAGWGGGVLQQDMWTIGSYLIMQAHKNVSNEAIYTLLETMSEHPEELKAAHPEAVEYVPKMVDLKVVAPYHPGAIKFYKEKGLWTDEAEELQEKLLSGK